MCGIAGIFWGRERVEPIEAESLVRGMNQTLVHRGPDADGVWVSSEGHCVLAHRRLSIIDTSDAGKQPMTSADGRWVVSFNGEIYNFLELKPKLEAAGYPFQGRTDTEVLLAVISLWGPSGIAQLDGMFAFAAYDTLSGRLLLGRDPFGEKPLYYTCFGRGGIAFASELQALETLPFFDNLLSLDAVGELFCFQYVGAPRTIYENVYKLPPGQFMDIDRDGNQVINSHYQFHPNGEEHAGRKLDDLADELESIMVRMLERRTISDVPLGAFLSGGVDSSLVCALIRNKLGRDLQTFSIGFEGTKESEHETARLFAKHLGCDHHDQLLQPQVSNFLRHFGEYVDEPHGDSSCLPTYLLSRFARQYVTVCLSGDGGDELFGGYGRYLASLKDLANPKEKSLPGELYYSNRILVHTESYIREILGFVPHSLVEHLARLRWNINHSPLPAIHRFRQTDQIHYLPGAVLSKVDRMSMQHSLEVRTPFLSRELAQFAEGIPPELLASPSKGKILLRHLAYRYLPTELVDMPKKGFGLPQSDWAKEEKLQLASEMLDRESSHLRVLIGDTGLDRYLERQRSKNGFSPYQLWNILALESWMRQHSYRLPDTNISKPQKQLPKAEIGSIHQDTIIMVKRVGSFAYSDELTSRFCLVVAEYDGQNGPAYQLDDWHTHANWIKERRLGALEGKTIIVGEPEFYKQLYWVPLERLHRQGLRRLVVPDPYDESVGPLGSWLVIDFQQRLSAFRRCLKTLLRCKLRPINVLPVKLSRRKHSLHEFHLQRLSKDAEPDVEKALDYFVFEDGRFLPQLPTSHLDIREKGRGRYSIWNGKLIVTPSRLKASRRKPRKFRVYPRNPESEALMPYTTSRLRLAEGSDAKGLAEHLHSFVPNRSDASSFKLKPGSKVALFTSSLQAGGAERQWCYLAKALHKLGLQVYFYTIQRLEGQHAHYCYMLNQVACRVVELQPLIEEENLSMVLDRVVEFGGALTMEKPEIDFTVNSEIWPEIRTLSRLLKRDGIETLFCQLDSINIIGGSAGLLAGIPRTVLSFRNYNPSHFSYLDQDYYRDCYHALAQSNRIRFTGNSKACNEDYAKWAGFSPKKVVHIPNAIDPEFLDYRMGNKPLRIRHELKLDEDAQILLGVFRLSQEKRPEDFLHVAARLLGQNSSLQIVLIGEGAMLNTIMQMGRDLSHPDRFHYLGCRNDVFQIMKQADLLLLTSAHEGMPNVILEAMAAALPVVATETGGVPDLVKDGKTGFICEVGDLDDIKNKCHNILNNPALARNMANEAQYAASENYSINRLGQRYYQLINND